ncbi:MAG: hypothetical protein WBW62_05425, partial [Solirubrobacterales bacterium]
VALTIAWLVAPTSASGPPGEPNGFVSGLRYLAPALAVSMALLGSAVGPKSFFMRWSAMGLIAMLLPFTVAFDSSWSLLQIAAGMLAAGVVFLLLIGGNILYRAGWSRPKLVAAAAVMLLLVMAGQAIQASYMDSRYRSPEFTTPGLGAAFAWAQDVNDTSIGTNATRQYPLFGAELDNRVQFIGEQREHAGFVTPESCEAFRQEVADGDYEYLVLTLDRPNKRRDFPVEAGWMASDPAVTEILREEPTVIYRLDGKPDPALCS